MATVYRWDDTDAPVISGSKGSLINLLDKVLVDGYGSMAAAGWTKEFVSANGNVAAYRNSPVTGLGFYYRVDDDEPQSGYARVSRIVGYETMTDVDTGAGPFPSANDVLAHKSTTNNTTARPWWAVADDRTIYLFIWSGSTDVIGSEIATLPIVMGDFLSVIPGDAYCAGVGGSDSYSGWYYGYMFHLNTFTSGGSNLFSPRRSDGSTGDIRTITLATSPLTGYPGYLVAFSYPWHGETLTQRLAIADGDNYTFRGYMPGIFIPMHQYPFNNFDTDSAGRVAITFYVAAYQCQVLIDVANFRQLP